MGFGFNKSVITGLLRDELGFDGIVCTDWNLITDRPELGDLGVARAWGVEHLSAQDRVVRVLEAGVDQFGGEDCTDVLLSVIRAGRVSESRIDESARRLLRMKFFLGLFDRPFVDEDDAAATVGREDFREAGLRAQRDSLTVVTNSGVLPLARGVKVFAPDFASLGGYGEQVDSPADADVAVLRIKAPFEPRTDGMAALFHHGSLEFGTDEVRRVRRRLCRRSDGDRRLPGPPGGADPVRRHRRRDRRELRGERGGPARRAVRRLGPGGSLPFDLPRSDAAVAASRSDVAFDTADPVFRFGHGLRYPELTGSRLHEAVGAPAALLRRDPTSSSPTGDQPHRRAACRSASATSAAPSRTAVAQPAEDVVQCGGRLPPPCLLLAGRPSRLRGSTPVAGARSGGPG